MFNAVLENACSEQGARMSAMDSSSRNAGDMLDRLTLTYNRYLFLSLVDACITHSTFRQIFCSGPSCIIASVTQILSEPMISLTSLFVCFVTELVKHQLPLN
jgi:hypothetical protein